MLWRFKLNKKPTNLNRACVLNIFNQVEKRKMSGPINLSREQESFSNIILTVKMVLFFFLIELLVGFCFNEIKS